MADVRGCRQAAGQVGRLKPGVGDRAHFVGATAHVHLAAGGIRQHHVEQRHSPFWPDRHRFRTQVVVGAGKTCVTDLSPTFVAVWRGNLGRLTAMAETLPGSRLGTIEPSYGIGAVGSRGHQSSRGRAAGIRNVHLDGPAVGRQGLSWRGSTSKACHRTAKIGCGHGQPIPDSEIVPSLGRERFRGGEHASRRPANLPMNPKFGTVLCRSACHQADARVCDLRRTRRGPAHAPQLFPGSFPPAQRRTPANRSRVPGSPAGNDSGPERLSPAVAPVPRIPEGVGPSGASGVGNRECHLDGPGGGRPPASRMARPTSKASHRAARIGCGHGQPMRRADQTIRAGTLPPSESFPAGSRNRSRAWKSFPVPRFPAGND